MTDWRYAIHRDRLIRRLCGSQKLPLDFSGRFYQYAIPGRNREQSDIPGYHTLRVYPSRKHAKRHGTGIHRTFVLCQCGREIPTGRFHQHKGACK